MPAVFLPSEGMYYDQEIKTLSNARDAFYNYLFTEEK